MTAHRKILLGLAVALIGVASNSAHAQSTNTPLTTVDKLYGLSLVWQEANYNFAFFDRQPERNWDSLYRDQIGRVLQTDTDLAYYRQMQRFLALYGEGHTNCGIPKSYRDEVAARPALELDELEHRAVVVNTARDLSKSVPVGSVITHVDGVPTDEHIEKEIFPYMSASTEHNRWQKAIRGNPWNYVGLLYGQVGSTVELTLEKPNGKAATVSIERLPADAEIAWDHPVRDSLPILEFKWLDNRIAYFAVNTFNDEAVVTEFEKHLADLSKAKAVILDIRNNGGGNSGNGWNIGRYFSDVPLEVSHWRTRKHIAVYKAWGNFSKSEKYRQYARMDGWETPDDFGTVDPPDTGTFNVPVAVLFGGSTYSAAEDFLSYMRANPLCVYIGSTSAGSTGQPLMFQLPGGAWARITSKRDFMPDGTEFVGVGIPPDIEVHETVEAFRNGTDLILERAVEELKSRIR